MDLEMGMMILFTGQIIKIFSSYALIIPMELELLNLKTIGFGKL
jgi:hypothetical protein